MGKLITVIVMMWVMSLDSLGSRSLHVAGYSPCPIARWTVLDDNGDTCMLMKFDGSIAYNGNNITTYTTLPPTMILVDDEGTRCNDRNVTCTLIFADVGYLWRLSLEFVADEDHQYYLANVTARISYASDVLIDESSRYDTFFVVPFGEYYTCEHFNVTLSGFDVYLTDPIFQPFVGKTESNCSFGTANECDSDQIPHSLSIAIIIGIVAGALLITVAIVVSVWCVIKPKKKFEKLENDNGPDGAKTNEIRKVLPQIEDMIATLPNQ